MQPSAKHAQTFLTVLFTVVLLLFSFFVFVFNQPFYNLLHDKHSPYGKQTTQDVLDFFLHNKPLPDNFTPAEILHLADVKFLIYSALAVLLVLLVVWILLFSKYGSVNVLYHGSLSTICLFLAVLLFFPFDSLFTGFHQVFFLQGTWQFPQDSTLIQAYSFAFFQDFFSVTVITALIISLFTVIITKISLSSSKT